MIPFPKDFHDFLSLLKQNEVRYMIVGGYALGYHGYIRATGDLDIFVEVSEKNAEALVKTFIDFGFDHGVGKELFLAKGKMVRVGNPPMRLEILTEISGVTFEECYSMCNKTIVDSLEVCFIDYDSLIKNKSSTGRPKDQVDVEHIRKDNPNKSR